MSNWMFETEASKRGLISMLASTATLGLDEDLNTFSLPANTTISSYIQTLLDDTTEALAQSTLGVTAGNSPNEYIRPSSYTVPSNELEGHIINNYGQTDDAVYWLPTATQNMEAYIVCGSAPGGKTLAIKADTNDKFYFSGGGSSSDGDIVYKSPSIGDCLHIFSFKTGSSTWDWLVIPLIGSWSYGAADTTRITTNGDTRITSGSDTRIISI